MISLTSNNTVLVLQSDFKKQAIAKNAPSVPPPPPPPLNLPLNQWQKLRDSCPLSPDSMFATTLLARSRPALSCISFTGLAQNWARGARILVIFKQVKCFLGLFYGMIASLNNVFNLIVATLFILFSRRVFTKLWVVSESSIKIKVRLHWILFLNFAYFSSYFQTEAFACTRNCAISLKLQMLQRWL